MMSRDHLIVSCRVTCHMNGSCLDFFFAHRYTVQCTDDENQRKIDEIIKETEGLQENIKSLKILSRYFIKEGRQK